MMFKAAKSRFFFLVVIMAVLALGVTAVGGTLAYNSSAGQPLAEGDKQKLDLLYSKGSSETYTSMFSSNAAAFTSSLKWYPGKTEIVYLKVQNVATNAMDCKLSLAVDSSGFGNMLTYAAIPDLTAKTSGHPTNWGDFKSVAESSGYAGTLKVTQEDGPYHPLTNDLTLAAGESRHLALAIHMDENASSQYENAVMNLHFVLQMNDHIAGN